MPKLTANQESFVVMMKKGDEHAAHGFEVLSNREDAAAFFDFLKECGFFDPNNAPGVVEADEPGVYRVPYWPALRYLEAVSKLAGLSNDIELGQNVMAIIRSVSLHRDEDGTVRDNHHTYRSFAVCLDELPPDVVTIEDIDLLKVWLRGRFDHGMVAHALDEGLLQSLLSSDQRDDWSKACQVLRHCTDITWRKRRAFHDEVAEPATIVDSFWLKKLVQNSSPAFGKKIGADASAVFTERLIEVFGGDRNQLSWLYRPSIEDDDQNRASNETENIFVEGLRDVLLNWIDANIDDARPCVERLLHDDVEILRRIGIYTLNVRWRLLSDIYPSILSPTFFDSGHLHEVYALLRQHFTELELSEQNKTLETIRRLPQPTDKPDAEGLLKRTQFKWLTAITGKGHSATDEWLSELRAELGIKDMPSHPDFHSYMTVRWGPGPSPFEAGELVVFAQEGSIVEKLNAFEPGGEFEGPTVESLVKSLEEAVRQRPEVLVGLLHSFSAANRPYQYGIINGFKTLWESSEDKSQALDWDKAWPALLEMFEGLLSNQEFWNEPIEQPQGLLPTRDWIPPLIADFLQAGTKNDEKAYSSELLPRAWPLIQILLERSEPTREVPDDPTMQAINSSKGRAIEALVNHALRACRVAHRVTGEHIEAWGEFKPTFDGELDKCRNNNYEFSTLAAQYIPNLQYLDAEWIVANIRKIFPEEYPNNLVCADDGLSYTGASSPLYKLLIENGIIDFALAQELRGRHARENLIQRIVLAYLWDDEDLDSPRFMYLFGSGRAEDLECASSFLWQSGRGDISDNQRERVLTFWERCVKWSENHPEPPASLLSGLGNLTLYLDSIGNRELRLLLSVAPYVRVDYHVDRFVQELGRLVDTSPLNVATVLRKVLDSHIPVYDFQDTLKTLLGKIATQGHRDEAIDLANRVSKYIPGVLTLYKELTSNP